MTLFLLVLVIALVYVTYQQSKQIKSLNARMNELEVRIVVRLEDRISSCEDSIQIIEHAHAINACSLANEIKASHKHD